MADFDPEQPRRDDATDPVHEATTVRSDPAFRDRRMVVPRPSFFDAIDGKTLVSVVVALVAVTLVELDAARHPAPLDALDLALRMVALTATARAVSNVALGISRFRAVASAAGRDVVLLDAHLVVLPSGRTGEPRPLVVPRRALVATAAGTSFDGVPRLFVVRRDDREGPLVELPPFLDLEAAVRRLDRYIEEADGEATSAFAEPTRDPQGTYERIVRSPGAGELAVAPSFAALARGPYATLAFLLVLTERVVVGDALFPRSPIVLALVAVCVLVPIGFVAFTLRRIRAMGGAAAVFTPAELLVRSSEGIHRAPWSDVSDTRVRSTRTFTLVAGATVERTLVVDRASSSSLALDARHFALPIEVVSTLVEAYRAGMVASVPASQGSGGGAGISAASGTTT